MSDTGFPLETFLLSRCRWLFSESGDKRTLTMTTDYSVLLLDFTLETVTADAVHANFFYVVQYSLLSLVTYSKQDCYSCVSSVLLLHFEPVLVITIVQSKPIIKTALTLFLDSC